MAGPVLHRLVVRHPVAATVLLVRAGEAWHLPEIELDERHTAEVEHLNAAVRERWGAATTVLRGLEHEETKGRVRRTHALEAHALETAPRNDLRWVPLTELAQLGTGEAEIDLCRRGLEAADAGDWTTPGWWPAVRRWIEAQLGPAEITQTRAWESSCVARVKARGGVFFFKAVPRGARETAVTALLARRRAPGAPEVVAAEPERNWLLMRAFAGACLDDSRDADVWRRAAATYGRLQASTLDCSEELRALGCLERDLDELASAIEPLLSDLAALMPGHPEGLSPEQVEAVRRLGPTLRQGCDTLASSALPLALDHGDLWPSNILFDAASCVLIDWEDAGLAHPFLGLAPLLAMRSEWRVQLDVEQIAAAYLPSFTRLAPLRDLERAFRAALPLGLFEMAVRYWRMPAATAALHPWMREMVPFFLRHALDHVEPGARRRSA